ncbi:MAG: hypothetical protein OXJ52_01220 [Oligoflexia bacterium]|nr:hypothetical protein [Oligoflexia bacterium]
MGDIIRGNWFANYLFMWGGDSHKTNLSEMTVFLDTPLIISLLGFHGELSEKAIGRGCHHWCAGGCCHTCV